MQAGRVLGIVNETELKELMEQAHIDVFGMTIKERELKKAKLAEQVLKDTDYKLLDIPAFLREKSSNDF